MKQSSPVGKPPRGKKLVQKSLKTVNLGLQYNLQTGVVDQPFKANDGLSSSMPLGSPLLNQSNSGSTHKYQKSSLGDLYFAPVSPQVYEHPSPVNISSPSTAHRHGLLSASGMSKMKQSVHDISSTLGSISQGQLAKSISPVEALPDGDRSNWRHHETRLPKTQVYLPGDRVIFAESPSAPGIPIVYRLADERQNNPDKLNLDRRKLCVCPILEGEENLRLLNLQHNMITRVQHLSTLRKLIFLDLYDNHLEEISGLSCLKSLRVLMLGKNRIKRISNLSDLSMLDVLDLHGNKIVKIEGVSHLHQLRVLNLAGNELANVKNLTGLHSLSELNLRRNYIQSVSEIETLPSLQRLFLSFNEVKSFADISCLAKSTSLIELSLDGNPLSLEANYKQIILQNILSIRQLDMKRLTDEERRIAVVMARKEEERKKESERIASLKEKRRLAINNAQRQWNMQRKSGSIRSSPGCGSSSGHSTCGSSISRPQSHSNYVAADGTDYSVCHLAEVDGESLNLFGPGALEAIDRNWGEKVTMAITTVTFKYIDFDAMVPHLTKLSSRFMNFQTLILAHTNISQLSQLNALANMKQLDHLDIHDQGNPITSLSLWKPYAIFRLAHLNLRLLNNKQITNADMVHAEKLFGPISHVTTSQLSQTRLLMLLAKQRRNGGDVHLDRMERSKSDLRHSRSPSGESVSKAGLIYNATTEQDKQDAAHRKAFASTFIHEVFQTAAQVERKRKVLRQIWPEVILEIVNNTVQRMNNMDVYMEDALSQIKRSLHVNIT